MSDALPPIKPPDHILPTLISNIPIATNHDAGPEGSLVKQNNPSAHNGKALAVAAASSAGVAGVASMNDARSSGNRPDSKSENQSAAGPTGRSLLEKNTHSGTQPEAQNKTSLNVDASASELADGTAFMRMLEKKQAGIDAWRGYAGLATAAALLAATLGWMGLNNAQADAQADKVEPIYDGISIIKNSDAEALWVVDSSTGAKKLRVTAVAPPTLEADQAFELWMVKADDGGVVSMGLLPSKANTSSQFNVNRFNDEAESFGVSVESVSGSPESIPTGPVLFQGNIQPLVN